MRIEHLEVHLNELLHDLASPLSSMRLQLGLLRDALRSDPKLIRRVENAERQLFRSQRIIDSFVTACGVKAGRTRASDVVRRVFERFGINVHDEAGDAIVPLDSEGFDFLVRSLAEGCAAFMSPGSATVGLGASESTFVVKVSGTFDQRVVARALRLSFVGDDGEPCLALAATRLAASAVNGTLLLDRDALVLRLPLVTE